jgi:hypothetical protein
MIARRDDRQQRQGGAILDARRFARLAEQQTDISDASRWHHTS